ncbi:hypothetical protein GLW00_07680 [Halobacillus litoralis]|uniref:HPr family phosphocarrier protein n=1 Tax=Halobacillus litoralis TaxID=45668 RepID=A0A845FAR4_9BACI|nr:hypothetical protein [Halobacillus sp. HZG1]MYL70725.1 hypothetical protein [Halobacillus litoralis]
MSELSSYQITLNRPLKTNQIMKVYKTISKTGCDLYLHQNQLIADAGHLPKLLSFFLFMDKDESFVMIIDGECVDDVYDQIEGEWQDHIAESTCRRKYDDAMVENETSILV